MIAQRRRGAWLLRLKKGSVFLITTLVTTVVPVQAAEGPSLSVELNKLEPQGKACRAYLVIDNLSDAAYQALKLDTYLFRTDGVIDRRLLIDLAPMQATKRSVKPFDLDGIACDAIGSFLVNNVTECRDASGPVADCLSRLRFTSRASATLSK